MEDPFPSSSFLDHYALSGCTLTEMLEYSDECEKSSSLGFMELLNMQDLEGASAFVDPSIDHHGRRRTNQNPTVQDQSMNAPATPNSSSISSESSDGHKDEHVKEEDEEEEDDDMDDNEKKKTKKQLVSLSLALSLSLLDRHVGKCVCLLCSCNDFRVGK